MASAGSDAVKTALVTDLDIGDALASPEPAAHLAALRLANAHYNTARSIDLNNHLDVAKRGLFLTVLLLALAVGELARRFL
jgi:hypothetical protein